MFGGYGLHDRSEESECLEAGVSKPGTRYLNDLWVYVARPNVRLGQVRWEDMTDVDPANQILTPRRVRVLVVLGVTGSEVK